jgi:hypothetical protein
LEERNAKAAKAAEDRHQRRRQRRIDYRYALSAVKADAALIKQPFIFLSEWPHGAQQVVMR